MVNRFKAVGSFARRGGLTGDTGFNIAELNRGPSDRRSILVQNSSHDGPFAGLRERR